MEKLFSLDIQEILLRVGLAFGAVLLIFVVRRLISRLVMPVLRRLSKRSKSDIDDTLLDAITTPIRLLAVALGIYVAAALLSPDGVDGFINHLTRTLVIIAVFMALYKMVGVLTRTTRLVTNLTGLRIDEQLLPFARTAIQVILMALAVVIVLQEWEYDVAGLVAGLGLSGLAFALAAEDTVSNLFGFTTIVGDRPLAVGEFIVTPDVTGIVEHVGFRSTRIRQLDQAIVTIPNSALANSVITNWSRLRERWINFTIGVTYATTSAQLRDVMARIEEMLKARESVREDTVTVLFTTFGGSSLDILIRAYVRIPGWGEFMAEQQEIMLAIMDIVAEMGLDFAFPSQSVYIEQMPAPPPEA